MRGPRVRGMDWWGHSEIGERMAVRKRAAQTRAFTQRLRAVCSALYASTRSSLHPRPAQNIDNPLSLDTEIPNPVEKRPENARGCSRMFEMNLQSKNHHALSFLVPEFSTWIIQSVDPMESHPIPHYAAVAIRRDAKTVRTATAT